MSRFLWSTAGVLALLVLLMCMGFPLEIPFTLLFGWPAFLARVIPHTHLSLAGLVTAIVCVAGVLWLGHRLAAWLFRETAAAPAAPRRWKPGWTLSLTVIVVLMFVSGIAAVGMVHQTYWLAKSDRPLFEYRGHETANRIKCGNNVKQIGMALTEYANDHEGRLPDSLEQLALTADVVSEVFVCPSSNDEKAEGATTAQWAARIRHAPYCSYIYHGRGLKTPLPPDRPILCEPMGNHKHAGMNILFGDGHVEFLTPADAQRVLDRLDVPLP